MRTECKFEVEILDSFIVSYTEHPEISEDEIVDLYKDLHVPKPQRKYELIQSVGDKPLYRADITGQYRAIVWQEGNRRILMSVCSRDDAYRRKFLKSVKYNPDRVVSPPWQVEASDQLHQAVEQEKPLGPLGTHSVKTIMRLGVSDEETAEQLRHIPFDALEAALIDLCNKGIVDVISMDNLYKLANGAPLSERLFKNERRPCFAYAQSLPSSPYE